MGKRGINRTSSRLLPAVCITAGLLLCCAIGLAAVDAGMRGVLHRDAAPAFAAALEDGQLSLWLLGRRFEVASGGLSALHDALEALAGRLRALLPAPAHTVELLRQALEKPIDIFYFTNPRSL